MQSHTYRSSPCHTSTPTQSRRPRKNCIASSNELAITRRTLDDELLVSPVFRYPPTPVFYSRQKLHTARHQKVEGTYHLGTTGLSPTVSILFDHSVPFFLPQIHPEHVGIRIIEREINRPRPGPRAEIKHLHDILLTSDRYMI